MPDQSAVIGFTGTWGTLTGDNFMHIFEPQNGTTPTDPKPTDPKPIDPKPEDPGATTPTPSFFAKLWNFILKWFLFGWLWMKK